MKKIYIRLENQRGNLFPYSSVRNVNMQLLTFSQVYLYYVDTDMCSYHKDICKTAIQLPQKQENNFFWSASSDHFRGTRFGKPCATVVVFPFIIKNCFSGDVNPVSSCGQVVLTVLFYKICLVELPYFHPRINITGRMRFKRTLSRSTFLINIIRVIV